MPSDVHPNPINSSYVKLSGNALQAGDIFYSVIWVGWLSGVGVHKLRTGKVLVKSDFLLQNIKNVLMLEEML